MTIKAWTHPIKYLRLVTTPTCCNRVNYEAASMFNGYRAYCTCERYIEHINRLNGTEYTRSLVSNARGTRWCDFEPIEEDSNE